MTTSAGIANSPYLVTVEPRACKCQLPAKVLGRAKKLDRAILLAAGYWNVYLAFFGDQMVWLEFLVTDMRDGVIVWRNGRLTREGKESNGQVAA